MVEQDRLAATVHTVLVRSHVEAAGRRAPAGWIKPLLVLAFAGMLAFGAAETAAFAADFSMSATARGDFPRTHWRVARRVVARHCIEVSQPPRGCPLRHYSRLPWPGVPRFDEPYYLEYGWHRCWWGEWC
jgi:hypothetical protein